MNLDSKSALLNGNAAKILEYVRKRVGVVAQVVLLLACTIGVYILLLYAAKYLWFIYTSTPIGQAYAKYFPQSYQITNDVLHRNLIHLAFNTTLSSFVICLIIGALFQFLHLTRYLYDGRGLIGKIVFFGLPLAYLSALYFSYLGEFGQLDTAFTMTVFPALGVFTGGFKLTEAWIPELSDLKNRFGRKKQGETSSGEQGTKFKEAGTSSRAYIIVATGAIIVAVIVISLVVEFSKPHNPATANALTVLTPAPAPAQEAGSADSRFVANADGTVLDQQTRLMWAAADNGKDVNWQSASVYCEKFRGGGYTDWRMPTRDELAALYDGTKSYKASQRNYDVHLTASIQLSASFVWTSETGGDFSAVFFAFANGAGNSIDQGNTNDFRALPVRSAN